MAKRRQTVFLDQAEYVEMTAEAMRQARSLSKIVQIAWRLARAEIKRLPRRPSGDMEGIRRCRQ